MRRFIGTALAVGLVAAVSWQVVEAQTNESQGLVVCTRTGADVRTPSSNGSCPSGYVKTTLDEPVFERNVGQTLTANFSLLSPQAPGDELDIELSAAGPDGEVRSTLVANVSEGGQMGFLTFADPAIGSYTFGIRVLGPMQRDGDTIEFRVIVKRSELDFDTLIDEFELELAFTGADIAVYTPFVYTATPTLRPPA